MPDLLAPFLELLAPFREILAGGRDLFKLKINGAPCPLVSGKVVLDVPVVHVSATYQDSIAHTLEASRPLVGGGVAEVTLDGRAQECARLTLSLVKHLTGVDLKVTVDVSEGGMPQEFELYCELASIPLFG